MIHLKKYPKGTVILTCHTGVGFAENCAKKGGVDLIFDGHEHKNDIKFVAETPIVALSQNFEKIVNAKIKPDNEEGKSSIELKELKPLSKDYKEGELSRFYRELFKRDTEKNPLIHYSGLEINKTDLMSAYSNGKFSSDFCSYIILKETNKPIEPDKTYKIAYPEKSQNEKIRALKNRSYPLNLNVHNLFKEFFASNKEITFTPDIRIY